MVEILMMMMLARMIVMKVIGDHGGDIDDDYFGWG